MPHFNKTFSIALSCWCIVLATVQSVDEIMSTQLERYLQAHPIAKKTYQLEVPGKDPITIIENFPAETGEWVDISIQTSDRDDHHFPPNIRLDPNDRKIVQNSLNTDRCLGPSCHKETVFLADDNIDEKTKSKLDAITALANKLVKQKLESEYNPQIKPNNNMKYEEFTDKAYPSSWNQLKNKKKPIDNKDGWITLDAVPWSTSKISKWKPNKQNRPSWQDEDVDRYSSIHNSFSNSNADSHIPQRPSYINNRPNFDDSFWTSSEKPSWTNGPFPNKFGTTWTADDSRNPNKHNCDNNHDHDGYKKKPVSVFYGVSDSIMTGHGPDRRPASSDYDTFHPNIHHKPTPVVYSDLSDVHHPSSYPVNGDGEWVLLSTTKGYQAAKKQQRSMSLNPAPPTVVHKTIKLTVWPPENPEANMTTSYDGLLEVDRNLRSIEQEKLEMDKKVRSTTTKPKTVSKHVVAQAGPDSSAILAAVGAGMLPATMAMVVPMMLGKRRKRNLKLYDINELSNVQYYTAN